ncbi:MAG TPA: cupin domain-containing protein [Armatimonadota bacterium]|nr:cupin domain-containing protein [Armatimonadota bacterium]
MRIRLFVIIMALVSGLARADQGLIGGIGLTHLTVYEQRKAPDGLNSGSPHVHGVTDEAYYILSGSGRVELHDLTHGFRTVDLKPGDYLQFPPCTLHRIISTRKLVILAVMGNAGLAERGDARIYFGKAVDDDPAEYARLVGLAKANGLEGALDRRDAAVKAYLGLMDLWKTDRQAYFAELRRFIGVHLNGLEKLKLSFGEAVQTGPLYWGRLTEQRLADLPQADEKQEPATHDLQTDLAYGMCGVLRPFLTLKPLGDTADKR